MSTIALNRRNLLALFLGAPLVIPSLIHANEDAADETLDGPAGLLPVGGNIQLQAIGGLGIGHIQSTLGLIGVLADSISKEMYSTKQLEDLMKGTINGLDAPKKMLRKLQDSDITGDDVEFLDRMISVFNALQGEARSLIIYAKTRKPDDAVKFENKRRAVLKKLGELTQQDEFLNPVAKPMAVPSSKSPADLVPPPGKTGDQSD